VTGEGFNYPAEFNSDPSTLDPTDNPNPEGSAYITARDYGQLLLLHLRDGVCGDTQVLSPEALTAMHSDRFADEYEGEPERPGRVDSAPGTAWAGGWIVTAVGSATAVHMARSRGLISTAATACIW
jgi:CubicO group peptidase (beta-lactamase class C family)